MAAPSKAEPAETVKSRLIEALQSEKLDYGRILSLSTELSKEDETSVRFSANATIIKRLGNELVARQETAVSELVKNAYDADATTVKAIFAGSKKAGGRLFIRDDGNGMTRQQIVDGFMCLSTDDKLKHPSSPKYKRQRAGRKGIGRFAAQRLGKKLTLITQTLDATKSLKVTIHWDRFEKSGELFEIANKIEECPKEEEHGTILIIDELREAWTDSQISRVYRFVDNLIQPFPLDKQEETPARTRDPGFKATFYRLEGVKEVPIASEQSMLYDFSVASVTGEVDGKGKGTFTIDTTRLKGGKETETIEAANSTSGRFKFLKNVRLVAYYFIFLPEMIPQTDRARISALADKQGGIKLYRNGFRVLPYGEPYNDWLNLNAAEAKREILPPLGNKNWFGFVEIQDPHDEYFEETSSREGIALTSNYDELVDFVHGALRATALRVGAIRGRKLTAGQKGYKRRQIVGDDPLANATQSIDALKQGAGSGGAPSGPAFALQITQLEDNVKEAQLERQSLIQELSMQRVLASLGLTIGMFTHEVATRLVAIRSELGTLAKVAGEDKGGKERLAVLGNHVKMLEAYISYFDAVVSNNSIRETEPQDLTKIVYDFWHEFEPVFSGRGIKILDPVIESGKSLETCSIHPSELASVLVNFLTNSAKAIRRASPAEGRILITVNRDNETLLLDFADNGDGIAKEHESRIFDAFFTTTHKASSIRNEADELTGTGLGLKIVHDIVSSHNGDVYLIPPPRGYTTCFRVELPVNQLS